MWKLKTTIPKDVFPIPDFPGYLISKVGKVWSAKSGKYLTVEKNKHGHNMVGFCKGNKNYEFSIARLLLTTFVRLPKPGEWARHLNDIPSDDSFENISWGTPQENSQDMFRNRHQHSFVGERQGEQNNMSKLFSLDVVNILRLCEEKKHTQVEIARMYSVNPGSVSNIKLGINWKHIYRIWIEIISEKAV